MEKNYSNYIYNDVLFLKPLETIQLTKLKFLLFWFLFFLSLTATYAQSCNVVKNGTFTGNANNWSLQTSTTGWYYESTYAPNKIYIDKDGINSPGVSLKQALTGLIGNSLTISFKIGGQNAGRTACNTTAKLEVKIGGVTYVTINNPANNTEINNASDLIFSPVVTNPSTSGFPLAVTGSNAFSLGTIEFTIPWLSGTNADLEFVVTSSDTPRGTGSCQDTFGGDDWILDDISVITSSPTASNVSICQGTASVDLTSSTVFSVPAPLMKYPTLANGGTGNVWSNPTNIFSNDNVSSIRTLNSNATSAIISATGYDFSSIPDNATITNIEVVIGRFANNSNSIRDATLNLIVGGTSTGGAGQANTTIFWGTTKLVASYSASRSSWGYGGLTPAQVKASNFGIAFSVNNNSSSSRTASIDYISVSVTYTVPDSIDWYTVSSGGTKIGSGSSFNPVGVDPRLPTTNSPGTYPFYVASSTAPECRTLVNFVINPKPAITNTTVTPCSGSTFTVSPVNGTNGVVPSGTTYSWSAPTATGITGAVSGTNATSISGNLTNSTNAAINVVYIVTPTSGSCSGSPFTVTVTVNPKPSITNITAIACSGSTFTVSPANGTNGVVPSGTTYSWSAPTATGIIGAVSGTNVTSISGNLTNSTNAAINVVYTVTPTSGSCTGSDFTVTVTVRPTVTASVSGTITVCQGSASPSLTFTNSVNLPITVTYNINGGTPATINVGASTTATIAAPTGTSGTFVYNLVSAVYQATPICSANLTGSATVTVNTVNTPTAAVTAQPNCSLLTGSITLSGLPTSGTINQTVNSVTTSFAVSQVEGEQIITGLAPGSYTFTVSSGGCTSGVSTPVTVVAFSELIATWNGSAWSPGAPSTDDRAVFNAPYISGSTSPVVSLANVNACSCYVKNGAVVVFNPGHTLNVINEVVVENGGSLTFENNASLVQHNEDPNINSGNIIYKRITKPVNRYDYTYWSSPITNVSDPQTLKKLSPDTFYDKYYSYDNGWKVSKYGVASMEKGRGYIIRAPQSYNINGPAQTYLAIFTGVPHNGEFTLSGLAASQAHLLGNPYPSAIDADVFLKLNSDIDVAEELRVLEGTLYFWTHNTPPSIPIPGDKKYNYTANDYATYNRTGGVGTAAKLHPLNYPAGVGNTNFSVPSGNIAAGQGFFAPAKAGGNVVFNNTMRISGGGVNGIDEGKGEDNSQFFKLSSGKTATTTVAKIEKNRIWLNLTNSEGAFKQTLVGYITGATNDYDGAFDGVTYNGNVFVDFYSVNNDVNLAIQGRALPFVKKDSVALGYRSAIIGDFQISIDQTDGVLSNQNVFLEDKDLKVLHDLKKEAYIFSTEKGTFNNRFVLRYVDKNAVDEVIPEVPDELNKAIVVALNKNEITIKSGVKTIDKVLVYDSAGKKLYQKNKVDANVFVVSHLISSHQVLVVDVLLLDGTKYSRKIVY